MTGCIIAKEGECFDVKGKKIVVSPVRCLAGLAVLFLLLLSVKKEMQTSETSFSDILRQSVAREVADSITGNLVPVLSFAQREQYQSNGMFQKQLAGIMPLYRYSMDLQKQENLPAEDELLYSELWEKGELLPKDELSSPEQSQSEQSQMEQMQAEQSQMEQSQPDPLKDLMIAENEAALQGEFVPHKLQNMLDLQSFSNYEMLVNTFYTIDSNTMAGSDQLDAAKLMEKDLRISKESEGPQILIYHTHSQEAFSDSVPGDVNTTIVGVGEHLTEILRDRYGYQVLHHTGQYDLETRDDAYSNSLPAIEQVLAENPSIEVVIDLHRDSMPEETRLVMDLDGRSTARFMFFNGLSRTKNTGDIAYLYNENQEDNLAFSFQMQLKAMEYYPGLTRKIYLKGYRYNMHLRPRTALIELGAQNNTVEEAMNACDPLAHIIDMVLSGTS